MYKDNILEIKYTIRKNKLLSHFYLHKIMFSSYVTLK